MRVARVGFTPLKGGRHLAQPSVELTEGGPRGDRAFCLVDPADRRCLRTVENPTLLQARVHWDGTELSVELPTGTLAGEPVPTGEVLRVDYWGRTPQAQIVDGPWAAALSRHLGREVLLAAFGPGEVVYGASVSLITDASLARLSDEVGSRLDAARFRATFQLSGDVEPHAEDDWVGRRLTLGTAEIEVRGLIPRCAVIDLDPASGVRDRRVLGALGAYRRRQGEIPFGVDAVVTVPGRLAAGDEARLVTGR